MTYRERQTSTDTGLPGRAKTALPGARVPNHIGRPGRCATPWKTRLNPSDARTAGT